MRLNLSRDLCVWHWSDFVRAAGLRLNWQAASIPPHFHRQCPQSLLPPVNLPLTLPHSLQPQANCEGKFLISVSSSSNDTGVDVAAKVDGSAVVGPA